MYLVCCIASLFVSRCRDKFSGSRVSIGAFPAMPSPGSSPWQSSHHSAMPCHVSWSLVEGTCARQHPHLEPLDKSTKKKKKKNPRGRCCSNGRRSGLGSETFLLQEISIKKTLHLTYLGMLHMLYYMKEKLQIAFIMT